MLRWLKRIFSRKPKREKERKKRYVVYLFESHLSALEKIGRLVGKTPAQLVKEGLDLYIADMEAHKEHK